MTEVLLEALSTLYHSSDSEAKKNASRWLENWRLQSEAWSISVSILNSNISNIEVLLFCVQTLVSKIQQDFEELPVGDLEQLRESLIVHFLKFGQDPHYASIRTQIALALAAFCAHAHNAFWSTHTCVQWFAEKLTQEPNANAFACLIELLIVIPEEANNLRIGLHPSRRTQYRQELQNDFLTVLQVLERFKDFASKVQILKVLANWFEFCSPLLLQSTFQRLGPFVQLAVETLSSIDEAFMPAVNTISELLQLIESETGSNRSEFQKLLNYIASSILERLPFFQQNIHETGNLEVVCGLARLFCELGIHHEELILAGNDMSSSLIDAILAVTSHPDSDVHAFAFDFWEKLSYIVISTQKYKSEYFISIFNRLLVVLLDLAMLPDDYLEMSEEQRQDIDRWSVWDAFMDAMSVIGCEEFLTILINNLLEYNQKPESIQNWKQIEALLFAIRAVHSRCKSTRDTLVGPLFSALGSVPDLPLLQFGVCKCISNYSRWLPTLVVQSGADPLQVLFPSIIRNLNHKESASAAIDAFCGICDSCNSHLDGHLAELMELYKQIILSVNASHKWIPDTNSSILISEANALDIIGTMVYGVSKLESTPDSISFLTTISEDLIRPIQDILHNSLSISQFEGKISILVTRLQTFFKECQNSQISAQILHEILLELLQIADKASSSTSVVEDICGCIRCGIKNSKEYCEDDIDTLVASLPKLFAETYHCGYLYISSEITKVFGKLPSHYQNVQKLVIDQLMLVNAKLKEPQDFHNEPDLADDAFLMAARVVHYCPEALFNDGIILMQALDTASKGILVHHIDACRSILSFIDAALCHSNPSNPDFIKTALTSNNRGFELTKILLAGATGALTTRVLEDVSDVLYTLLSWSEDLKLGWLQNALQLIPEQVLSIGEKNDLTESLKSAIHKQAKRIFVRLVEDLSDICRRSRVTRIASQKALLPEEFQQSVR